jgi:hypothetical protein
MRSRIIYIHQKNPVSLSFDRKKLSNNKFEEYNDTRQPDHHLIQEDPKSYFYNIRSGMYQITAKDCFTFASAKDISRTYFQSDAVYHYMMRYLNVNLFNKSQIGSNCVMEHVSQPLQSVSSTFYPEDCLDINASDYYQVWFKGMSQPLYLCGDTKLFDDTNHQRSLMDMLCKTGRRTVLGLTSGHEFTSFDIEKVKNITQEEEPMDILDTPFYEFRIFNDHPYNKGLCLLMNHVLVDLD